MNNDSLALAKITNDNEWQAYRDLVEAENKKYGIEAEPLPESRSEPSAEVKLGQTIDKAIGLWQRDSQRIKGMFSGVGKQLQNDSQYHYYQARSYLENTVSGAMSIVEDTLGLSHYQSTNYFVEPDDFLGDYLEEYSSSQTSEVQPETELNNSEGNLLDKFVAKGVEDIAAAEQAVFGF